MRQTRDGGRPKRSGGKMEWQVLCFMGLLLGCGVMDWLAGGGILGLGVAVGTWFVGMYVLEWVERSID
jgi:hypothetical protein